MMAIMLKIKIIIKKYLKKQKTNTIRTNKTLITDKTLAGEERKKILIYYIQTMKRLPCLICSVNITFIKECMSLTYGTRTTLLRAWFDSICSFRKLRCLLL